MKLLFSFFITLISFGTLLSQQWEPVPATPDNFRTDHSFGFSIGDIGYLVSGAIEGGIFSANFYSFDPGSEEWSRLEDFPGGARGFAIGEVYEGKAYFGFGMDLNGNRLSDLWVFDPADMSWTELANCECPARIHPAFVIEDGVIYVSMGGSVTGDLDDHWAYDINTNTWSQKAKFPDGRRHHPYQFGIDGYVYAGFGHTGQNIYNEWFRYDPSADVWEEMAELPAEGRVAGTQFSYDGKGYVLSGDGDDHNSMETGEFWEYDPTLNIWTEMPPHPGGSRWAPASFIIGGEVYLIGGWTWDFEGGMSGFYPTENWKYSLDQDVSSVGDHEFDRLTVYPNPADNYITIGEEVVNLNVYHVNGQLASTMTVHNGKVDISKLTTGLYILRGTTKSGKVYHTKLEKK